MAILCPNHGKAMTPPPWDQSILTCKTCIGKDASGKKIWCDVRVPNPDFIVQAPPPPPPQATPVPAPAPSQAQSLLRATLDAAIASLDAASRLWRGNPQEADEMLNLARRIFHEYAFPAALGKVAQPANPPVVRADADIPF